MREAFGGGVLRCLAAQFEICLGEFSPGTFCGTKCIGLLFEFFWHFGYFSDSYWHSLENLENVVLGCGASQPIASPSLPMSEFLSSGQGQSAVLGNMLA